jgi:hypothetical protein
MQSSTSLWVLHSVASFHVTSNSSALSSLLSLEFPLNILTTDGTSHSVASRGTLSTTSFYVPDISHVHRLTMNLFSIAFTNFVCHVIIDVESCLSRIDTPKLWLGLALGSVTLQAFGTSTGFMFLLRKPSPPLVDMLLQLLLSLF